MNDEMIRAVVNRLKLNNDRLVETQEEGRTILRFTSNDGMEFRYSIRNGLLWFQVKVDTVDPTMKLDHEWVTITTHHIKNIYENFEQSGLL